jgi:hypothetical protein
MTRSSESGRERPRISRAAISAWKRLRCLIDRVNRPCALPWLVIGLRAGAGRTVRGYLSCAAVDAHAPRPSAGIVSIKERKALASITSSREGIVVVTVAVRLIRVTTAISPITAPGSAEAIVEPSCSTLRRLRCKCLARGDIDNLGGGSNRFDLGRGQAFEQRNLLQQFDVRRCAHGSILGHVALSH